MMVILYVNKIGNDNKKDGIYVIIGLYFYIILLVMW